MKWFQPNTSMLHPLVSTYHLERLGRGGTRPPSAGTHLSSQLAQRPPHHPPWHQMILVCTSFALTSAQSKSLHRRWLCWQLLRRVRLPSERSWSARYSSIDVARIAEHERTIGQAVGREQRVHGDMMLQVPEYNCVCIFVSWCKHRSAERHSS